MKNELHPWEVGLAEQVKGKEFSFDPQAFADFENLLEAETLGQETGQQAPPDPEAGMAAGGITNFPPIALLLVGLICFSGWWFWPRAATFSGPAQEVTAPATALSASSSAPSTFTAPAAAHEPSIPKSSPTSPSSTEFKNYPPSVTTSATPPVREAHLSIGSSLAAETVEAAPAPRNTMQIKQLPTMPEIRTVSSVQPKILTLPEVRKLTPETRKRDRKTLFPDILNKN